MRNTQTSKDLSEYEDLKEQLRSEIMMSDYRGQPAKGKMLGNLREELLDELEYRERMRQQRAEGPISSRLNEGREAWQDFKNDILGELDERMQGLPLIGDRRQKRPPLTERQLLDELRRELELDLQAQGIYQRHWQTHPQGYGRMILQDLMREAEAQGYTRSQILQAVQGLQGRGTLRGKLGDWLASPEGRSFKYGVMAAGLALILWPTARKSLQPLFKGLVRESMEAAENIQSFFSGLTEDLQDVIAEAQFERSKDLLDQQIAHSGASDLSPDL
ncbi:MAG: hypothetical protein VB084_09400 [Syntrophomonadaceae bacterium]|nr:hypothetical protein [Syntrophomonadaceae bacterium]